MSRFLAWPCLLIAVFAVSVCAQAEQSRSLIFVETSNLDTSNDALRLTYSYTQSPNGEICMEAERASVLRFTPGRGVMGKDNLASGGHYVAFVDHMEFHFEARQAGTYTAWYRALFPWAGHWNHTENMDGGPTHAHTDSTGEVLNEWIWVQGPKYELSAGKHSWNFTPFGWCGGAQLDKVLLLPEGVGPPQGLGPEVSPFSVPVPAQALSGEIMPRALLRWIGLRWENLTGAGSLPAEYSQDRGRTWQAVPAGGSLAGVPTDRPLVFRLTLQPDAAGMTPYVPRAEVAYQVRRVPPLVLSNSQVELRFSGSTGALLGIRNLATDTEYKVEGKESPLFSFVGFRPEFSTLVEIGFDQAELREASGPTNRGELTLAYDLLGGSLQVRMRIRLQGQLARFGMEVTNRSPYDIAQVRMLPLQGLCIGEDPSDDYLFTPITTGCIAPYPASLQFPRTIYTDRPLGWPGMATMCWMNLWDDTGGGLYMAWEDKEYRLTELTFSNGTGDRPQPEGTGAPLPPTGEGWKLAPTPGTYVNLGFDKRLRIPGGGGRAQVPEAVLGVHGGGWHWAADRYREWAASWMQPLQQVPDWLRDVEGWTDCHMIHLGRFVDLTKGRPKGGRTITMQDPPYPLIAMWAQMASCEAHWATPVLHRLLGTEEQYRGGVQKHHEMGHRFISYNLPSNINPTFHRGYPRAGIVPMSMYPDDEVPPEGFYPEVGVRLYDGALRSPDGVYSEANVCNAATKWQEYIRHIVLNKYCRDYLNDGMYLDGAGLYDMGTQDCKNLQHGHSDYGVWAAGFLDWLSKVRAEARRERPGSIFAGEGMGDVYMTQLDLSLFYADNAPEVYRYTLPWNIGVIHGYEMAHFSHDEWPPGYMELAVVYGMKFGGTDYTFERDVERAQRILDFRRTFSQFQFRGRFMDDQGLFLDEPGIHAKLFTREDAGNRGALVAVYNREKKAGVVCGVAQERVGRLGAAWYLDLDNELRPLAVELREGRYIFTLPDSELLAVLLVERSEPFILVDRVQPVVPGESGMAVVTVMNLESRELAGQVSLGLPRGWKGSSQPFRLTSGASETFRLAFEVPAGTKYDVYDLYGVTRDGNRTTDKCVPMGVCRPVQAELHWQDRRTLRLVMSNSSDKAVSGTCRLVLPAGVTVDPAESRFNLRPRGAGEITLHLQNVESIVTLEHVKAVLTYGEDLTEAYEVLQPPLLNGNFELSTAGDGWPDYWNYRRPELLFLKGAVLDTEDKVEGNQSLRLEPNVDQDENALQTIFLRLAPDTRYRLSGWIKSDTWKGVGITLMSMGGLDPARRVSLTLTGGEDTPTGEWQRFEGEFLSADIEIPYLVHISNWGRNPTPVWFDDIRLEEVPEG